jgi:Pvc16 N-terminal domain
MADYRAIAAVTATLRQLIQEALDIDVAGADVSVLRPDLAANNVGTGRVNIFLYQVTTNSAFRNVDLPTRDSNGLLVQCPRVALDLHYLFSFYGEEVTFTPQLLLGSVVRTLHTVPQLPRTKIAQTITNINALIGVGLESDPELVKFTPLPLSLEELSKLWSILIQTPYALSIVYIATVVIIEGKETPSIALPVKKPLVTVLPFRRPTISRLLSQKPGDTFPKPNEPIVVGDMLILQGKQLLGDAGITTLIQIAKELVPPNDQDASNTQLSVVVPPTATIGIQGVQVVQQMLLGDPKVAGSVKPHASFESNIVPFVVHPVITKITPDNLVDDGQGFFSGNITIEVTPELAENQRIVLLLNEQNNPDDPAAYSFIINSLSKESILNDPKSVKIPIAQVKRALYSLRLQVDGAESILGDDPLLNTVKIPPI